ncbi:hypothetical protein [Pseudorhodoferax sp. Leaf265]|uniref:hypothetical protein n=1 Tax=Pseudorhodoferax sp. Leaf265 TaxID=1736315 RepID=UPI0012E80EAF|nr:hypothetical protein [Pseudorhodoferax sp. Leaf265]
MVTPLLSIHILGAGRSAFLEFLRNLTPCFLFASVALFLSVRLDFNRVDLSNWAPTFAFIVCALVSAFAFFANLSAFLDSALGPNQRLERAARRLRLRGAHPRRIAAALLVLKLRMQPGVVVQVLVAFLVVNAALYGGVFASAGAVVAALKNGLR